MAEGNAERKEVEDYLRRHNLQSVMNEVINSIIKERAEFPLDAIARKLQDRDERGIIEVLGREVLDASGRPTVCVDVKTSRGVFSASVPRAPPAEFGAKELADVDVERYAGGGTTMAVKMVRPPESRAVRAHAHGTDTLHVCVHRTGRRGGAADQRANWASLGWHRRPRSKSSGQEARRLGRHRGPVPVRRERDACDEHGSGACRCGSGQEATV